MRKLVFLLLLVSALLLAAAPLLAFDGTAPAATAAAVPLAVKIVALSGGVYALLQTVKKIFFPSLGGYAGIGLNVALNALGVIALVPSDQLFTVTTGVALLSAVLGSAGLHGIGKTVTG